MEHITKAERTGQSKLSHKSSYCISWLLILNDHVEWRRSDKGEERTSSTGSRASNAGTESENALTTDRLLHHIRRVSHNSGVSRNIHVDLVQSASLYNRTTGFVSSFFPFHSVWCEWQQPFVISTCLSSFVNSYTPWGAWSGVLRVPITTRSSLHLFLLRPCLCRPIPWATITAPSNPLIIDPFALILTSLHQR